MTVRNLTGHGKCSVDPGTPRTFDHHLIAGLVRAVDWFDNCLQNILASEGFEPLHRTQSMIMVHIASGIESPAEIAREMGVSRQNVYHMAKTLIENGLIEQSVDPLDPRRTYYHLAGSAMKIRSVALDTLRNLEIVVANRIGTSSVSALQEILGTDWGDEIQDTEGMVAAMETRSHERAR